MNAKIARFLVEKRPETPCLVVDLDVVAENYKTLQRLLPWVHIYYAVKANPAPEILRVLVDLGSNFDTSSIYEIEECLRVGARPETISFSNTIKKERDIAAACGCSPSIRPRNWRSSPRRLRARMSIAA